MVSLSMAGAVFGAVAAGPFADLYGRKPLIILSTIVVIIGSLVASTAQFISMLMIARLIMGLGMGIITLITPLYLSELSPVHIRG